jgi:ATP-binding cassette subfamily F protein uup
MLGDYPGTVLLVSHDRDFLDRVVTSVIVSEGDGRWLEYAGGYSDMVAQRGGGVERRVAEPARPGSTASERPRAKLKGGTPMLRPTIEPPTRRAKLSFKEKHALDTLPTRMESLRSEIARLQAFLADASSYARDPVGFDQAAAALKQAETAVAAAEDEWLALELKREALEGA